MITGKICSATKEFYRLKEWMKNSSFRVNTCCSRDTLAKKLLLGVKAKKRECRFVFIGRNLDHKMLEQGFLDCKAEDLRFNVGDTIYANIGEFTEGKILKCWDEGNPYRVEIQNAEKSNVWVPIDDDRYVPQFSVNRYKGH